MVPEPEARRDLGERLDLSGRVAVVTGGGTHIGRAIAADLGTLGAKVWIVGRRREVLDRATRDLRERDVDCFVHPADVSVTEEADAAIHAILGAHGRLDVMVCNAGGGVRTPAFPESGSAELRAAFEQNVVTAFLCARAAARPMIERGQGSIVLIGSIHGSLGDDKRLVSDKFPRSGPPYQVAKGAVINMTRSLACELAEFGVRVNCVSPGHVPKPSVDPEVLAVWREATPLRRTGVPEDVAGAVAFLATDAAAWITGQNLVVDGGWSAW